MEYSLVNKPTLQSTSILNYYHHLFFIYIYYLSDLKYYFKYVKL
jgi:hypothetical protein